MKRIIALILALILVTGLFGCGTIPEDAPPTIHYLYNTSESHAAIGEYFQSALAAAGITVKLTNQEWGTFLNTRKRGDFTVARSGWLADYSDPISFLDMWTSDSGNNDAGLGRGNHREIRIYSLDLTELGYDVKIDRGSWHDTYDRLIALIKECRDEDVRYALMHKAEDLLMETGCVMPLYFYTDLYMLDSDVEGFYTSPLGYKFFTNCTYGGRPSLSVCLASEPASLDPALSSTVDSATMLAHLFTGLAKWESDGKGGAYIAPDALVALPDGTPNEDGTITYLYTLREGLLWSDGAPLTAHDFEFAWRRAADPSLGADYGYMLDVIARNEKGEIMVRAIDTTHLEVTLKTPVSYWNELLAFPTFYPVRSDVVKNEGWATEATTYVSSGPYVISKWDHNSCITLSLNEKYIDKSDVLMPEIKFYLSDDSNNMLTNFKNGTFQLIDDIPTGEIEALRKNYPDELRSQGQIGTYYAVWNVNADLLPRSSELRGDEKYSAEAEIRRAISLLIDRNYIAEEIGKAGQVPASSFVALGIKNPDGTEFSETAGKNEGYKGYFDTSREAFRDNSLAAVAILKKYYALDIP